MSESGQPQSVDPRVVLFVCQGPGCGERGGQRLLDDMRSWLSSSPARRHMRVCSTSCMDSCATGPNVLRTGDGGLHTGLDGEAARALLAQQAEALGVPAREPARQALERLALPTRARASGGTAAFGGWDGSGMRAADRAD